MAKSKSGKLQQAFTERGTVHPIRASSGYSPRKAGEKAKPASKKGKRR